MTASLFMAFRGISNHPENPFSGFFPLPDPSIYWQEFAGYPQYPDRLTPLVDIQWVNFAPGLPIVLAESDIGPALAVFRGRLFLVWTGRHARPEDPDAGLVWWSTFDPVTQLWTLPDGVGLRSSRSPSLAVFEDLLFVACRGYGSDGNIHWSSFDGTTWDSSGLGGLSGVNQDVGTANAPTIAAWQGPLDPKPFLYMVWRGIDLDQNLWWAAFNGTTWTSQRQIGGAATSNGPAMAVFQNQLFLVWNGAAFDPSIWFTSFDGEQRDWYDKSQVPGVATNESPAVTVFQDRLYMAWGGLGRSNIFWSFFDGQNWAEQKMTSALTASGPAIVAFDATPSPAMARRWLYAEIRRLTEQALLVTRSDLASQEKVSESKPNSEPKPKPKSKRKSK